MSRMSGATSRTAKVSALSGSTSITRCEPSIMPMPSSWAAAAKFRLMVAASFAPPVMAPMSTGAASRLPKNSVDKSTPARLELGNAI
ncbi:Uncharacterised protein [Mycobacteroides abscessus subsp. abscessus]|nr:Uncharacterised protein [Mycobacteroides abscessus subsp. abscessus]SKZ41540.1 Uncharacterised protein [Mycobacteroides abscessus subsp. abscessus]